MFHYMAKSAFNGSVMANFKSEKAMFKPVHHNDVTQAVSHQLGGGTPGHYGLYGTEEQAHSINQLLGMVETVVGKQASAKNPILHGITSLADDFFVGHTHDGNMDAMLAHYEEHGSDFHNL